MNQELIFEFNDKQIVFQLTKEGKDVKVNATQMAKAFNKDVPDFMILKNTKDFISACLNNQNPGYLNVETEEDLITSKQKSGTYMHRILAIKFAAWLNPDFEIWIYSVIDNLLFGMYAEQKKRLKERAKKLNRLEELIDNAEENPELEEYISLTGDNKKLIAQSRTENSAQLNIFRDILKTKK